MKCKMRRFDNRTWSFINGSEQVFSSPFLCKTFSLLSAANYLSTNFSLKIWYFIVLKLFYKHISVSWVLNLGYLLFTFHPDPTIIFIPRPDQNSACQPTSYKINICATYFFIFFCFPFIFSYLISFSAVFPLPLFLSASFSFSFLLVPISFHPLPVFHPTVSRVSLKFRKMCFLQLFQTCMRTLPRREGFLSQVPFLWRLLQEQSC